MLGVSLAGLQIKKALYLEKDFFQMVIFGPNLRPTAVRKPGMSLSCPTSLRIPPADLLSEGRRPPPPPFCPTALNIDGACLLLWSGQRLLQVSSLAAARSPPLPP